MSSLRERLAARKEQTQKLLQATTLLMATKNDTPKTVRHLV
jgi:hypothetical protein